MMKKLWLVLGILPFLAVSCAHHKHEALHAHAHGPQCGHTSIVHESHTDYLDDGHLHFQHAGHADDHRLAVGSQNPSQCTPNHVCATHPKGHTHGPRCGHAAVPHGDHQDYLVENHLHHPDGAHCDDHGPVKVASR